MHPAAWRSFSFTAVFCIAMSAADLYGCRLLRHGECTPLAMRCAGGDPAHPETASVVQQCGTDGVWDELYDCAGVVPVHREWRCGYDRESTDPHPLLQCVPSARWMRNPTVRTESP